MGDPSSHLSEVYDDSQLGDGQDFPEEFWQATVEWNYVGLEGVRGELEVLAKTARSEVPWEIDRLSERSSD